MSKLTPFEGSAVLSAGVEVRNAAGGLNEALGIEPEEYHKDDEVTVIMRCTVKGVRFDKVKDTDGLKRVHIMTANTAAIVDDSFGADVLEKQRIKIEEAKGVRNLDAGALSIAHFNGEHEDDPVDGCEECAIKAAEAEA